MSKPYILNSSYTANFHIEMVFYLTYLDSGFQDLIQYHWEFSFTSGYLCVESGVRPPGTVQELLLVLCPGVTQE